MPVNKLSAGQAYVFNPQRAGGLLFATIILLNRSSAAPYYDYTHPRDTDLDRYWDILITDTSGNSFIRERWLFALAQNTDDAYSFLSYLTLVGDVSSLK